MWSNFKVKILLFIFWSYTWLCFQFSKLCEFLLKNILIWVPDKYIPIFKTSTNPVNIVKACDDNGNIITSKLQLFLNAKWDKDMCDDKGGVDIDLFTKYLNIKSIWVVYSLQYDLDALHNTFIWDVKNNEITQSYVTKLIKFIIINVEKKCLFKMGKFESIMFGEINFHYENQSYKI